MVITPKQHLFVWFNKKDAILNYVKVNNLHVMWNGNVIDTLDDYDIVNVVF
jgi:Fe-S cluster assembly ATPase SufC